jgi:hypothetical protein
LKDHYVSSNVCTQCAIGTSINAGGDASGSDTVCHATVCDAGYYVSSNKCVKCAAGTTRAGGDLVTGVNTVCTAEKCATANEYVKADKTCAPCPVGTSAYSSAQSRATPSTSSCTAVKCLKDEYVKITGTCADTATPANNRAGNNCGATNLEACTSSKAVCEASAAVPATWTKATAVCTACPTGWTRTAGDNLATAPATTTCTDPASEGGPYKPTCLLNHFVKNHVCTPCVAAPGVNDGTSKTRPAGDDPNSNVDTACANSATPLPHGQHGTGHDTLCLKNFHVQNFACAACPAGTTNAAGDDPHHFDTVCHKTLCKVNEYVNTHVCTPCSAAHGHTTNTAGDDASGADTTCY